MERKVLLICAGGMSTGILMRKMEKYAEEHGDSRVNAKSIMGMMSLALLNGEEILVDAEGADEAEAVAAIEEFLVS